MNELQIFKNEQFGEIRTVEINGEPWMVGKDIAAALGYSNHRDALSRHVDADDKDTVAFHDGTSGNPNQTIINESGLYSLVMSSKLPNAKQFKRWVTSDVLPTIRKHGAYMTPETIEAALLNPDTIINLAKQLKTEREQRIALEAQAEADKPKVLFADAVSASHTAILVGDLAKLLRQNGVYIGQNRLFQRLRDEGWLGSRGEMWNMPTQRSMELGLFQIKETTINNPDGSIRVTKTVKVSGKGQQYFINRYLNRAAGV